MFELDIQIKVALHTGAEVNLTPEQMHRIKNYATEVLLGAPSLPTPPVIKTRKAYKTRKRKRVLHSWTPEEDQLIMDVIKRYEHVPEKQQSKARVQELKQLHRTKLSHMSWPAVYSRYSDSNAARRKSKNELATAQSWNPVAIRIS